MTFVKLCGMTRAADVGVAADLEVDAVGFVLWAGSPRSVAAADLAALVRALPPQVLPVGVFVRPSSDEVARAVDAGVRAVQLHGMNAAALAGLDAGVETWVAVALAEDGITPAVANDRLILLDALDPVRHGGTGRTIDWAGAARVAAARRVLLAGGLTPTNVAAAIQHVRPYGVDVASGIEERPGIKHHQAMRRFVAAVREAD